MTNVHCALELIAVLLSGQVPEIGQALKTPQNFERIFKTSMYWIQFRKNPADATARQQERGFLLNFFTGELPRPDLYLEVLKPWAWEHEFAPLEQQARELQSKLRDELADPLSHRVIEEALRLFEIPNGIGRLNEDNRLTSFKYVLFNLKSPLWSDAGLRKKFLTIFDRAVENSTVHENCIDFFELVLKGMRNGLDGTPIEDLRILPKDEEFARQLWKGVVARKIQYRMQLHILDGRQRLIEGGTPEAALPIPEWLAARQTKTTT